MSNAYTSSIYQYISSGRTIQPSNVKCINQLLSAELVRPKISHKQLCQYNVQSSFDIDCLLYMFKYIMCRAVFNCPVVLRSYVLSTLLNNLLPNQNNLQPVRMYSCTSNTSVDITASTFLLNVWFLRFPRNRTLEYLSCLRETKTSRFHLCRIISHWQPTVSPSTSFQTFIFTKWIQCNVTISSRRLDNTFQYFKVLKIGDILTCAAAVRWSLAHFSGKAHWGLPSPEPPLVPPSYYPLPFLPPPIFHRFFPAESPTLVLAS